MKSSTIALCGLAQVVAGFGGSALNPTISLDYATFKGAANPLNGIDSFLGMPFATAGRLENPRLPDKIPGVFDATFYGPACPQQELVASPLEQGNKDLGELLGLVESFFPNLTRQAEDCLNINVQVPKGVNDTSKLPVLFWIHGGGFELGSAAAIGSETTALPGVIYQGANLVQRSVEMGEPVVFVSANYRLNFFGTLASQEITDAGVQNLFLKDQDVAFEWIQKYISKFGGDPDKVTVFGESAGAMSISTQMVLNNGNVDGKFNAAWIFSGPAPRLHDYHHVQHVFDGLMNDIGCGGAQDKVLCARAAPYEQIYAAVQGQTNFLSYTATLVPWYPRPDGTYLVDSPGNLAAEGKVAKIPYVMGNMVDEGTLFSLITQLNVTTEEDLVDYFQTVYFPKAPRGMVQQLVDHYPADPTQGSLFNTGHLNQIGPMYKRISAIISDYTFISGRRATLDATYNKQNVWSYQIVDNLPLLGQSDLLNALHVTDLPVLGSFHISDVVLYAFGTIPAAINKNSLNIMSSLITFANHHDPNVASSQGLDLPFWPKYNPTDRMQFKFAENGTETFPDDYRTAAFNFINDNREVFRG